ncbi:hypothetical protein EJB05_19399, partial [Eragrostis curvula]
MASVISSTYESIALINTTCAFDGVICRAHAAIRKGRGKAICRSARARRNPAPAPISGRRCRGSSTSTLCCPTGTRARASSNWTSTPSDAFDTADDTELPANRFTEPPVVARIDVAHHKVQNFVSHDTKIFAMPHEEASPAIPVFDTHTLGLSLCPCIDGNYGEPLFASAAGKLFAFMDDLTALYLAGDPTPHDGASAAAWSWTSMDWPPPFYASHVTCYALHPDGRTLFVSADASRHRHRGGPDSDPLKYWSKFREVIVARINSSCDRPIGNQRTRLRCYSRAKEKKLTVPYPDPDPRTPIRRGQGHVRHLLPGH